jgi:hypothetical protein
MKMTEKPKLEAVFGPEHADNWSIGFGVNGMRFRFNPTSLCLTESRRWTDANLRIVPNAPNFPRICNCPNVQFVALLHEPHGSFDTFSIASVCFERNVALTSKLAQRLIARTIGYAISHY